MKSVKKISVTLITLNEEENIENALRSVESFAGETIVVDSGSKDKTVEIAKKFGAKVFERKFDNYASQKNFAASKATNEWIFSIDADEEVDNKLGKEVVSAIEDDKYDAYSMPRKNIILGKFVKHTRWQPELDRHVWLWKKTNGKWTGKVHEEVRVNGKIGRLKNYKIHHQYKTVKSFLEMMNKYSSLDAEEKDKSRFTILNILFQPVYNFLVRYFYRLGILDGWRGFMLSYLMAIYHFQVWVKVWSKK